MRNTSHPNLLVAQQDADHLTAGSLVRRLRKSLGCHALPCSDTWTRTAKAEWTGCGIRASQRPSASWPLSVTSSGRRSKKHLCVDCRGVRPNREADWHPSESHPGTQIPGLGLKCRHPSDPRAAQKNLAEHVQDQAEFLDTKLKPKLNASQAGQGHVSRGRRSLRVRHVSLLPVVVRSNLRLARHRASTVQRPGGMERRDAGTDRCDQHDGRQHRDDV